MIFLLRIYGVLIIILVTSCGGLFPHPHEAELKVGYENSKRIMTEAERTFDTSHLSEAFTDRAIEDIEKQLAVKKEQSLKGNPTSIYGEEAEVAWVHVLEYSPPEAVIEARYFYRHYTYNRENGEITYYDEPRRYWRTLKIRMRQGEGKWKVDEALEFVDWSG